MASNTRLQQTASELAWRLAIKYTEALRLVRTLSRDETAKILLDARVRGYNWAGGENPEVAAKLVEDMIACGSIGEAGRDADPTEVVNLWSRCSSLTLQQRSALLAKANVPLMLRTVDLVAGDLVNMLPVMRIVGADEPALVAARASMAIVNTVEFVLSPDNAPMVILETDQFSCVVAAIRPVQMKPGKARCDICGTPRAATAECPGCDVRKPNYGYRKDMWPKSAVMTARAATV